MTVWHVYFAYAIVKIIHAHIEYFNWQATFKQTVLMSNNILVLIFEYNSSSSIVFLLSNGCIIIQTRYWCLKTFFIFCE